MPNITFVTAQFPGVLKVGIEGEKLGLWNLVELGGADRIAIPSSSCYILGAWQPGAYDQLLKVLEGSKIGICWCSSVGEMQFEPIEQEYLASIIANPEIDFVWFGDKSLGEVWKKGFYAPYGMKLPDEEYIPRPKQNIVTFFCPATTKKNILNQLVAIALLQRTNSAILHTNVPVDTAFAASIKLKYVQHGWLPQEQYQELIASSKLNFAVSWAETYSFQAAEALMLGTLSVLSHTIPWAMPYLTVRNPNDPIEIAEVAMKVLAISDPEAKEKGYSIDEFRRSLISYLTDANAHLRFAITSLAA